MFSLILIGFFILLSLAPGLLCPDGFYHIKMGQIIGSSFPGIFKDFPWLQFTILKDGFSDHHFLFHILASPFVAVSPFLGMKVFISLTIATFSALFYFLLKKLKVKYPLFLIFLLFTSGSFIFRLLLLRPVSLSLIFLLLSFYFLKEKKYLWLFILGFLFVWSYDAFPLILLFSLIFFFVEKYKNRRWNFTPIIYVLSGLTAGIIINPHFPKNLSFFKTHLLKIPFLNGLYSVSVGSEWYPIDLLTILRGSFLAWLIFCGIIAVVVSCWGNFKRFREKVSVEGFSAVILSGFFFLLTVRSQRFIEYWTPFTVLAGALVARDFEIDKKFINFLKGIFRQGSEPWRNNRLLKLAKFLPISAVCLFIFMIFLNSIAGNYSALKNTPPYDRYKPSVEWLQKNTPQNSIVFNVSWDDFPELFYWNTHNYYIVGMDPTFMYEYDKNLYEKWRAVGSGEDKKPGETVKKYFSSETIFANKFKNSKFLETASADQSLEKSYEDSWSVIYKIKN